MEHSMDGFSLTADTEAKGDFIDLCVKPQQWLVAWLKSQAAWEPTLIMEFKVSGYVLLARLTMYNILRSASKLPPQNVYQHCAQFADDSDVWSMTYGLSYILAELQFLQG